MVPAPNVALPWALMPAPSTARSLTAKPPPDWPRTVALNLGRAGKQALQPRVAGIEVGRAAADREGRLRRRRAIRRWSRRGRRQAPGRQAARWRDVGEADGRAALEGTGCGRAVEGDGTTGGRQASLCRRQRLSPCRRSRPPSAAAAHPWLMPGAQSTSRWRRPRRAGRRAACRRQADRFGGPRRRATGQRRECGHRSSAVRRHGRRAPGGWHRRRAPPCR